MKAAKGILTTATSQEAEGRGRKRHEILDAINRICRIKMINVLPQRDTEKL
jgi:hypothetical protein